jgi:hypothetical protein
VSLAPGRCVWELYFLLNEGFSFDNVGESGLPLFKLVVKI